MNLQATTSQKAKTLPKCRFFNTPQGCRNADQCPYRHVQLTHAQLGDTRTGASGPGASGLPQTGRPPPSHPPPKQLPTHATTAGPQNPLATVEPPPNPLTTAGGSGSLIKTSDEDLLSDKRARFSNSRRQKTPAATKLRREAAASQEKLHSQSAEARERRNPQKKKVSGRPKACNKVVEGDATHVQEKEVRRVRAKKNGPERLAVHPPILPFTWQREEKALKLIFALQELTEDPVSENDDRMSGVDERERLQAPTVKDESVEKRVDGEEERALSESRALCHYNLILRPSDPDIPSSLLFPNGLFLRLDILASYKVTGKSQECPTLFVSDDAVDEYVQKGVKSAWMSLWADSISDCRPVYTALKKLDEQLVQILLKAADRKQTAAHWAVGPWTELEQERLEQGLIWFRKVADTKARWKNISDFVKSRSPRQCAERYQHCKLLTAHSNPPTETQPTETNKVDVSATVRDKQAPAVENFTHAQVGQEQLEQEPPTSNDTVTPQATTRGRQQAETESGPVKGQIVALRGLRLSNLGVVTVTKLSFLLECHRCGKKVDQTITPARANSAGASIGAMTCTNCHGEIRMKSMAELGHSSGQGVVCRVEIFGGYVCDVLPSDFLATCLNCNGNIKFNEVYTGVARTTVCRHCHVKTSFVFDALQILGEQTAQPGGHYVPIRKPRVRDALKLTVGEPLPKEGTCRHYKKSYRWFRFPCCGKAYPCDTCHDNDNDHPYEQALRIICGHCSRESSAQIKECTCGQAMTAGKSTHWEGGKGCRDPTLMSRKDDKKFKLLARANAATKKRGG